MKENMEWAMRVVPLLYRDCTLDSFQDENGGVAKKICGDFINGYKPTGSQGLLFIGRTGVGKTHLAVAIYREIISRGKISSEGVRFVTAPELLLEIRKTFDDRNVTGQTESSVIDKYSETKLLILDDLGSEKTTDFAIQSLYLVIDRRSRNMKPTIVTTNLSLREIEEKLDARIASRLSDMKIVKIDMPDYRKKR